MKKSYFLIISFSKLLLYEFIFSSVSKLSAQKSVSVQYVETNDFNIDGVLDETMWEKAIPTGDFTESGYYMSDYKGVYLQLEM